VLVVGSADRGADVGCADISADY